MTILLIGSVLLGAALGRFFKVLVLVPACAFVLAAVLVRSADVEHGLLRPLLEFAVLITSLQIAYVLGLISSFATRKATPCALATPTAATVGRDAEVRRDAVSGQGLTHLPAAGFANPEVDEFSEAEWVKRSVRPRPRNEV
jgi:hypothetical protein